MTLIKICSGKGRFSQSGGSFFQNFPWHVGPNHGGSSCVTKYLAPPLFQTCRQPCIVVCDRGSVWNPSNCECECDKHIIMLGNI